LPAETQPWRTPTLAFTVAAKTAKTRRPSGRPPSGLRAGEKVKEYPQLSLRLPPESKARLSALSLVGGRPQWRVVTDAIDCYFRERAPEEQQAVADHVRRLLGRPRRSVG
jgi:predicted DNA-binding protein